MSEHFGPYRIDTLIGQGGMGEVHRAFDTARARHVALKRLPAALAADPGFQARFRAEAQMAARLRSAHVIPIHDYGEIDGQLFLDMRLVEGHDLAHRLSGGQVLHPPEAVHVITQVAAALDAAHAAGLEHRDVKPSNVLLSADEQVDGMAFAYLVDFGIARAVDATCGLTGTADVVGTLAYMAPERFTAGTSDRRADVYSLACVLAETLTGSKPFRTDSAAAAMFCHLQHPPPRPSVLRPGIPQAFDAVVARGMAKNPDDRFPTAGALAAAARAALTATHVLPAPTAHSTLVGAWTAAPGGTSPGGWPMPAPTPPPSTRVAPGTGPSPTRRRRGVWPLLVASLVVLALLGTSGALFYTARATDNPTTSTAQPEPAAGPRVLRVASNLPVNAATGLAIDAPRGRFYVGRPGTGSVNTWVVEARDSDDGALLATIPLPEQTSATDLALSPDGRTLYAAVSDTSLPRRTGPNAEQLAVIDIDRATIAATVPMPARVTSLAVAPDGRTVYAAAGAQLAVIDPTARRITRTVATAQAGDADLAATPDGRSVVVAGSSGVQTIDPVAGRVTATVGLRDDPSAIAITPDGTRALITTRATNTLVLLDLRTGQATGSIPVGERPDQVTVTPDGTQALVSNQTPGTVSVITLATAAVATLSIGSSPDAVAVSPDGRYALAVTSSNVVRLEPAQ